MRPARPVTLALADQPIGAPAEASESGERLRGLATAASAATGDVGAALRLARDLGDQLPRPGSGRTRELWEALATLGATDLTVARAVEPHLDARAILDEAGLGELAVDGTWGVFAAEGAGARLEAREESGTTILSGTKPWCSLASRLSHALVTAWCGPTQRRLYAVQLGQAGVRASDEGWVARGLTDVPSGPLHLDGVAAAPVGDPGWYLERPGFAWGGMGVAAVWFGAAVAVGRRLLDTASVREPDQIGLMHIGAVDAALSGARALLAEAARAVDAGCATGSAGAVLALRVRQVVAHATETVLAHVDHGLGPAPLALDEEHARRVADLRLYVRQEHAERDQAALGTHLVSATKASPRRHDEPTASSGGPG